MRGGGLSRNEQLVLYGLVAHPAVNDRLLADLISLKMSTVTAIKNRLKRRGFFRVARIPHVNHLGCEILTIATVRLNPVVPLDRIVKTARRILDEIPECVYASADQTTLFAVGMSRNYTQARKRADQVFGALTENDLLEEDGSSCDHFPFERSKLFSYFDFGPLLRRHFDIAIREPKVRSDPSFEAFETIPMTRVERKTLLGLIAAPDTVDNTIAKRIGVTRQSLTKIRKKFEAQKIIAPVKLPDLGKLGFEVFSTFHAEFNPKFSLRQRFVTLEKAREAGPIPLLISDDHTTAGFRVSADFRSYHQYRTQAAAMYRKEGYLAEAPHSHLMSVQDMVEIKSHVYLPLVQQLIGNDLA